MRYTVYFGIFPIQGKRNVCFLRCGKQTSDRILRRNVKIDGLSCEFNCALVKIRKFYNVLDKAYHALRFRIYLFAESGFVLICDHSVCEKFRVSRYCLERGFEFVRHVCRKFASHLLRSFFFGHVKHKQCGSRHFSVCRNGVCEQLTVSVSQRKNFFLIFPRKCYLCRLFQVDGRFFGENIFSDGVFRKPEHLCRCSVNA